MMTEREPVDGLDSVDRLREPQESQAAGPNRSAPKRHMGVDLDLRFFGFGQLKGVLRKRTQLVLFDLHRDLDLRFVSGLVRTRRQNRRSVVLCELLIVALHRRLVPARARHRTREIVGNPQPHRQLHPAHRVAPADLWAGDETGRGLGLLLHWDQRALQWGKDGAIRSLDSRTLRRKRTPWTQQAARLR